MNNSNKLQAAKAEAIVERLTHTEHYTGMHRERFNVTGNGIDIKRRENLAQNPSKI